MINKKNNLQSENKIKTCTELQRIIGSRPRAKKVIMCHGTFDLVHPGHLRHLQYAKSQADILIVSLTADTHISKADYRPMIPQNLRAFNLAAIEFVDYVLIDENPTSIENIRKLEPDYFAKGYDYISGGIPPRTQEEIDAMSAFGGEIIFTPGDVVFSSSHFIENAPPNIGIEKLDALMKHGKITFDKLRECLTRFNDLKVIVIGDIIVDTYTFCTVQGSSTSKSPTISTKVESSTNFLGGAGAVANHVQSAGCNVQLISLVGDDAIGEFAIKELDTNGINKLVISEKGRPTTNKQVFIADRHRLLKVDVVDNRPVADKTLNEILDAIKRSTYDIIILSDFKHGIFNKHSIPIILNSIPPHVTKVADSQVASRWGNILDFIGFDLITPNEKEARFALGDQDSVVRALCTELYKRAECKNLILKMGSKGLMYQFAQPGTEIAYFQIDSLADHVVDPVGAGDALLSYSSLALHVSGNSYISGIFGAIAAGIACGQEGNIPITPAQILSKINLLEQKVLYK